ncbi:MAG: hypothetical protein R3D02_12315 [Hyphomicrobiales bacterium]
MTIAPHTAGQIAELRLAGRPLVVCDVDEVVMSFIGPFETFLIDSGYRLVARSYGLTGNIERLDDGTAIRQAEVGRLLDTFFARETGRQRPVEGAIEALAALDAVADIVFLTNLPAAYRDERAAALARHGVPYPVVANDGPKGPAVTRLAAGAARPVFFLDDSPSNIISVRDAGAATHVIHFVADRRFFDLVDPIDGIALKSNSWPETGRFISDAIGAFGTKET